MEVAIIVLLFVALGVLVVLVLRKSAVDLSPLNARLDLLEKLQERGELTLKSEFDLSRKSGEEQSRGLRGEVQSALKQSTDSLVQSVDRISSAQQVRLEDFSNQLAALKQAGDAGNAQLRVELSGTLNQFKDGLDKRLAESAAQLQQHFGSFASQLGTLSEKTEKKFDALRESVEARLTQLQTDNMAKLEEMRRTVDEKLQGTLDKRLGESFKLVSERLELVHKGLGDMQTLAAGVGDLKRVLTNVKTRGTWGEMRLGHLLEDVLGPERYSCNVQTNPSSRDVVEFAIKLPGKDDPGGKPVWLPIDSKFPKEDYERLVDASERGDAAGVEDAVGRLETQIKAWARDIKDKYIAPPHTTDFGLLYLPTEGLYAEALRRPGLVDSLQREQRVVIVGPTTLAALLNSLDMGFRTLAIQKRSSEVWKVLGAVKAEFGKFGDVLDKVKKKLDETSNTIDEAAHRSRQLEKKLRKVEALPAAEAAELLDGGPVAAADDAAEGDET